MKKPFKVHRFGHSLVVTVPKHIADQLRWKAGTEVMIESVDGRLVATDVPTRTKELLEIRIRESIHKLSKVS